MNERESIRFPFLGVRENGEPFEYLLFDSDKEAANIAIFKWMVNYTQLNLKERVELFLPSFLTVIHQFRNHSAGVVGTIKKENHEGGDFYIVSFDKENAGLSLAHGPKELAETLPLEFSLTDMLIQLLKDSLILKQGILVYLKHLAPYFSRIVDYSPQEYQSLENFIFDDIRNRIKKNEEELKELYLSVKDLKDPKNIPISLNLEYLRENIESEISLDLFVAAFSQASSQDELLNLLKKSEYQDKYKLKYSYMNYLISIKDLEKRLYSNYNQIVLIYLKSI